MKRLIVVLLTVLLTTSGCGAFSSAFPEPMTITAQFRDSVGLYVGNEVTMLGIGIGEVERIRPRGTFTEVELSINRHNKIPAGAGAVTISPSVVTDRHVEITPAYRGGPVMRDGDLIPLDRTRTPIELDKVVESVDELATQLSKTEGGRGVLSDATDVAARNLDGNGKRINETIKKFSRAVQGSAGRRDALTSLIKNTDQLTTAAARHDADIRTFSTRLTEVTELFEEQAPVMSDALRGLNGLLDETTALIKKHRAGARDSFNKAAKTVHNLARRGGSLAETLDTLPLLSQNVARAVNKDNGKLRVHSDLFQLVLDTDAINLLCDRLGIGLPGCRSGRMAEFGPDLGVTEMLLGAVK